MYCWLLLHIPVLLMTAFVLQGHICMSTTISTSWHVYAGSHVAHLIDFNHSFSVDLLHSHLLPNTSALVFCSFFFTTTFSGNLVLTSCRGAWQRADTAWGRSRTLFSRGSTGGRGSSGFTPRWCKHWERKPRKDQWDPLQRQHGFHSQCHTPESLYYWRTIREGCEGE